MNTASVPRSFSIGRLVATPRVLEEIPCWDLVSRPVPPYGL